MVLAGIGLGALTLFQGCDNSASTGQAATGTGTGGNAGTSTSSTTGTPPPGSIHNVPRDAKSIPGKTARMALDLKEQVVQRDDQAMGMAGEISGEMQVVTVAGLQWWVPTEWERGPGSAMRAAEFTVPGGSGGGSLVFFYFGEAGQGGTVDANIERWRTMVLDPNGGNAEPVVDRGRKIAGYPVTTVEMDGTYMDGPPAGQKVARPDWSFRGVIVEGPKGNVFIRLTAPTEAMGQIEPMFDRVFGGMRAE